MILKFPELCVVLCIQLWDIRDGMCKQTFSGHESDINAITVSRERATRICVLCVVAMAFSKHLYCFLFCLDLEVIQTLLFSLSFLVLQLICLNFLYLPFSLFLYHVNDCSFVHCFPCNIAD